MDKKSFARRTLDKLMNHMRYVYNPMRDLKHKKFQELSENVACENIGNAVDLIGDIFQGVDNGLVQAIFSQVLGMSIYLSSEDSKHAEILLEVAFYNVSNGLNAASSNNGTKDQISVKAKFPTKLIDQNVRLH